MIALKAGDILGGMYEGGFVEWCKTCQGFQYHISTNECAACEGFMELEDILDDPVTIIGNLYETKTTGNSGELELNIGSV